MLQGRMGKGEAVSLEAAPYCRAPELLKNGMYSTATDIYALGMLMYEILYRREPFAGEPAEVCVPVCMPFATEKFFVNERCDTKSRVYMQLPVQLFFHSMQQDVQV